MDAHPLRHTFSPKTPDSVCKANLNTELYHGVNGIPSVSKKFEEFVIEITRFKMSHAVSSSVLFPSCHPSVIVRQVAQTCVLK